VISLKTAYKTSVPNFHTRYSHAPLDIIDKLNWQINAALSAAG